MSNKSNHKNDSHQPGVLPTGDGVNKFLNHLSERLESLQGWLEKNEIEAYRWYDHGLDDFPFSIDIYLDNLHIHWTKKEEIGKADLNLLNDFFSREFEFEKSKIYIKSREQQKGAAQYNKLNSSGKRFIVQENKKLFYINLADYFDSGLFLDHRDARLLVGEKSKGKKVLNLFSYTGAFSVYAARGGAIETVTVDTSNTYLDWAEANFKLNKIERGQHEFVKYDAVTYLREASKVKSRMFDIVVIDPPTFSNSKSRDTVFEIKRDHPELINNALAILNPGGFVLFSTNFTKFKLKTDLLYSKKITDITTSTTPPDFKDSPFIRYCYLIEKP